MRDKDDKEDGDEGTTTSREEIDGPDEDAEQDNDVYDGDKDVDQDSIWGSGNYKADEW